MNVLPDGLDHGYDSGTTEHQLYSKLSTVVLTEIAPGGLMLLW